MQNVYATKYRFTVQYYSQYSRSFYLVFEGVLTGSVTCFMVHFGSPK